MSEAFAQGRIVDLILLLVAVELVVLTAVAMRSGRTALLRGLVANVLAGAFLLAALRGALSGAAWPWIAMFLLAALVAHAADLLARWRG